MSEAAEQRKGYKEMAIESRITLALGAMVLASIGYMVNIITDLQRTQTKMAVTIGVTSERVEIQGRMIEQLTDRMLIRTGDRYTSSDARKDRNLFDKQLLILEKRVNVIEKDHQKVMLHIARGSDNG